MEDLDINLTVEEQMLNADASVDLTQRPYHVDTNILDVYEVAEEEGRDFDELENILDVDNVEGYRYHIDVLHQNQEGIYNEVLEGSMNYPAIILLANADDDLPDNNGEIHKYKSSPIVVETLLSSYIIEGKDFNVYLETETGYQFIKSIEGNMKNLLRLSKVKDFKNIVWSFEKDKEFRLISKLEIYKYARVVLNQDLI